MFVFLQSNVKQSAWVVRNNNREYLLFLPCVNLNAALVRKRKWRRWRCVCECPFSALRSWGKGGASSVSEQNSNLNWMGGGELDKFDLNNLSLMFRLPLFCIQRICVSSFYSVCGWTYYAWSNNSQSRDFKSRILSYFFFSNVSYQGHMGPLSFLSTPSDFNITNISLSWVYKWLTLSTKFFNYSLL